VAGRAERLRLLQEKPDAPEDLARIPRLTLDDLPRREKGIPAEELATAVPVLFHELPTNGVSYVEAVFDLAALPAELYPLLPLFGRALLEMGTAQRDFVGLNMAIACKTGGMSAEPLVLADRADGSPLPHFVLSGKAAPATVGDLFGLFREVLAEARFDDCERFSRMVLEEKARMEQSLVPSGHALVASRLRASQSAPGCMEECMNGVSALFFTRELSLRLEKDWPGVLKDLETVRGLTLTRNGLRCNITAEGSCKARLGEEAEKLAAALPASSAGPAPAWTAGAFPGREALLLPAQVNYVGRGANLYALGYVYNGSAQVILKHLRTGWLWEKVRVQGGAYGAFCSFDRMTGSFALVSYRDPNITATLDVFARSAGHLQKLTLDKRELSAAIVGAIGEVDAYLLPDARGMASFARRLTGETAELRQRMRDEIFSTTQREFREFGQVLEAAMEKGRVCALGGAALEKTAADQGWSMLRLL
jgi:Zn-dependent M16 (insulinase) family peptidase